MMTASTSRRANTTLTDQNTITATVASRLSGRPHLFLTADGMIGAAVDGRPMPYRVLVAILMTEMFEIWVRCPSSDRAKTYDRDGLEFGQAANSISEGSPESVYDYEICRTAVRQMWAVLASARNGKQRLIEMLRAVEDDYAALLGVCPVRLEGGSVIDAPA